jgi:chromosomal replication initiator protein
MFTNEFIQAVRADKVEAFRRAYRAVDLLCVDDVHFLSSKQATQEELLHTFDALDLAGARVAMASDEHPKQIRRLNRALVSRCMSGMMRSAAG